MTTENRGTLQPGDLCLVVATAGIDVDPAHAYIIGRTVICVATIDAPFIQFFRHSPYWRCSGLPLGWAISHELLRKIPPESMLDARMHDEPIETSEETTV